MRMNAISRAPIGTVGRRFGALGFFSFWLPVAEPPLPSGTCARSSATTASGALLVPVMMRVVRIARRPSSSTDSSRAATSSGSPAGKGARCSMRQPALTTRAIG